MLLFGKSKKNEPHARDFKLAEGIYLKDPIMDHSHLMINCFLRSLIVFMLVFGAVGGFLSAFSISYNYILVIVFYLLLSLYFSFIYTTSRMLFRDVGYIAFFIVFVGAVYIFWQYANSGFYEIVNRVLERAKTFFDLPGVREYDVRINMPYTTVAITAIFIGLILIIVLNIWIYSVMSVGWTLILTFPLYFIPLYMKMPPNPFYSALLIAGYVCVVVFKANGHYIAFAWDTPFHQRGLRKDRITYTQDGKVFGGILSVALIFSICIVMLTEMIIPSTTFDSRFSNDSLREKTSGYIGNFLMLGFGSFFDRYVSTGGMAEGMLGGVSNVRPDYLPDLIVSFAPFSNQAMYLKGFTGGTYERDHWEGIYASGSKRTSDSGFEDIEVFRSESNEDVAKHLAYDYEKKEEHSAKARIDIKNVGANETYMYYPYYTEINDYSKFYNYSILKYEHGIHLNKTKSYAFYPKIDWTDVENKPVYEMNTGLVGAGYLDVPEENIEVIDAEIEKMGLSQAMSESEIVGRVAEYFDENIPYTLNPGKMPEDADFVNYFLTKNRKGYCAHFASAATLIFRRMGIPARYVEGYAFSMETAFDSDIDESKKYKDYYDGYSELGESAVMQVEVTDANAHAWVEIYVEGFGWKVVEVTPGSNEATDESSFWDAVSRMLNRQQDDGQGVNFGDLDIKKFAIIFYIVAVILMFLWVKAIVSWLIRKIRRYASCNQKDKKLAMIAYYKELCDMNRECDPYFDSNRSHLEQLTYMKKRYCYDIDDEKMARMLEEISFSEKDARQEDLEYLKTNIEKLIKAYKKFLGFKDRFRLLKR